MPFLLLLNYKREQFKIYNNQNTILTYLLIITKFVNQIKNNNQQWQIYTYILLPININLKRN